MPRADQPIRQWTILKLLESNGRVTLRQISDALSETCHERTLRRDLDVLGLVGFPIYAERENGKSVWKLDDAYKRAPLPLTGTELYALQCGMQMMAPLEGTFLADAIQGLTQKIKANLPAKSKDYLALLQQTIQIGMPPYKVYKAHRSRIDPIRRAIETGKTIEIRYTPLRTGRPATRAVNPYRLWHYGGTLYLIGYCHERKDTRTFVIDRIASLQVTGRPFQIPFYFSIDDYFKDAFGVYRGEAEDVSLLFEKKAALWVRERRWHRSQKITPLRGGKIQLDLRVAITPELMQWVMGFGAQVEVTAPVRLRRMVENEAWKVAGKYQKGKINAVAKTASAKKREI
ncbi:helix-turn-helix transcriptional regulator [Candidatus Manganitrophus noduliformans]|uniref:YafY family transcriptional regulator n=1 Tax=Candidatus Manganitrophus noduliformans TaxID=2606439 RepID=A0A7X6IBJ3_9BACT|nr:YafY family protein [Candidatus Manganitrophus noduliformans]NKE71708.1 YafY family transcriptional regulator [Candidatus Manganitrophus noduliformans]